MRKHLCRLLDNLTKVRVMTKKTAKIEKPKEKEKGPPAYTVDDAMNKGRQLPQMLDFHKDRCRPVDHLCTSANSIWFSQKQGGWGTWLHLVRLTLLISNFLYFWLFLVWVYVSFDFAELLTFLHLIAGLSSRTMRTCWSFLRRCPITWFVKTSLLKLLQSCR